MYSSIFSNPNIYHLAELFFWMLGAFLIGLFFNNFKKNKSKNSHSNQTNEFDDLQIKDDVSIIRAKKTFERGGKQMKKEPSSENQQNGLNFERIGISSSENNDNLQLIKGIGASIEEKLNNIGIYNFNQIRNFNSKDMTKITELIKFFPGRIERDDWVGQAYTLSSKTKE